MKKRHLSFRHSHSSSDPSIFFPSPWNLFTQIFIWINPARHGLLLSYSWDREVCVCVAGIGGGQQHFVYTRQDLRVHRSIKKHLENVSFLSMNPAFLLYCIKANCCCYSPELIGGLKKKYEAKCTREWINKKSVHPFQPTAKKTNSIGDVFLLTQLDSSCCLSVCLSVQI